MPESRPSSTLLAGGVVGPAVFVVGFLVEGATRVGYDPVRQFVSLLALGDGGWIQVANFVVCGLLVAGFGLGLRRTWSSGPGSTWVPRLVTLAGASLVWCGVFAADPGLGYPAGAPAGLPTTTSWHAGLHYLGATAFFVALPMAILGAARRAVGRGRTTFALLSVAAATVMLGGWLGGFVVTGPDGVDPVAGLLQRIAVVAGLGWVAVQAGFELRAHDEAVVAAAAA